MGRKKLRKFFSPRYSRTRGAESAFRDIFRNSAASPSKSALLNLKHLVVRFSDKRERRERAA